MWQTSKKDKKGLVILLLIKIESTADQSTFAFDFFWQIMIEILSKENANSLNKWNPNIPYRSYFISITQTSENSSTFSTGGTAGALWQRMPSFYHFLLMDRQWPFAYCPTTWPVCAPLVSQFVGYQMCTLCTRMAITHEAWIGAVILASAKDMLSPFPLSTFMLESQNDVCMTMTNNNFQIAN